MGNAVGKSDEIVYTEATCPRPRRGTCARYMFDKYGPDSVRDVANWCVWTMNSKLPFPENGTFDRDCLNHLRKVLEGNEEDQRGARGVLKEEIRKAWREGSADTTQRERAPLGDRFGVQTRYRKATLKAAFSLQSLQR